MKEPLREAVESIIERFRKAWLPSSDDEYYQDDAINDIEELFQTYLDEIEAAMPEKVLDNKEGCVNELHWGKCLGYNQAVEQQRAVFKRFKKGTK